MTKEEIRDIIAKVASMYGTRRYTQEDIAKEIGISLEKVRMMTQRLGYHHTIHDEEKVVVILFEEWKDIFEYEE